MAGHGGRREGSGAKKNQHRVAVGELRAAIEKEAGMSYPEILALMHKKLLNDFKNDINVKECITFNENMNKRILEQPIQEVVVTNPIEELTNDEIKDRLNNLLARAALSTPAESSGDNSDKEA